MKNVHTYRPFPVVKLENRQWPNNEITSAPTWCSVDLRDGNQSLPNPMGVEGKMRMFELLVQCGFKEIEVGFPSANDTEFEFVRKLIEENRIPEDVTIQVLVQAREDLIVRTIESVVGAKKVIIHLYNSTSPAQREIVFGFSKAETVALAVRGTEWVKKYAQRLKGTEVVFEYSPESFSATEIEFAHEVCEAVVSAWKPTPERKMILNLPDTVEVASCKTYADQVEWICRNISCRDSVIISVHTHNDRGTGTAATELALCAGAERVEGTLFGNGERTGNQDIIITALNLYTQGIDPGLDFSDLDSIREVYEACTGMTVHDRHPYSGSLVDTAFSGSHQDAIRKGLKVVRAEHWNVPYLPINPKDKGRTYSEVVRINGQSGKGGVTHILETNYGIMIPKGMQKEFGPIANTIIDRRGREVSPEEIRNMFLEEYVERDSPFKLMCFRHEYPAIFVSAEYSSCTACVFRGDEEVKLVGQGNGPIDAFTNALHDAKIAEVRVVEYFEHSLGEGSSATAIAYVCLCFSNGVCRWGAGIDTSTELASIKAILSALNRK